jgi:hypothetical protein
MAKQKFRPTRLGGFSRAKAYIRYVEVLKKRRNAVGRNFCDAMAKQKFRPTRLGGFSRAKAYIRYVEVLKKRRNAVGRTFCDAIKKTPPANRAEAFFVPFPGLYPGQRTSW